MSISYNPKADDLVYKTRENNQKPNIKASNFIIWFDKELSLYAIKISNFNEELKEFKRNLNIVRLGGIWQGIEITDKDIEDARQDLLKIIEGRW
ncbi:MAG: hypothetical protein A2Y62_16700 [Candidatus Fischerbacteria bacterium RBG_13_37_8]|uniref:DUF2283 domain-containing protein n=1 Tax=Candidatus Fischerbacteria bacterium RBG_13_37_8 TaxID=1817863 RepID=A0A1F5V5B1_9BACT|nr:MAG: hypothetical protein A2Y62_16700 [Candidatus Fischerbacteria bacterium RBG_13_37_8]